MRVCAFDSGPPLLCFVCISASRSGFPLLIVACGCCCLVAAFRISFFLFCHVFGVGLVPAFRFSIAVCLRIRNGFPLFIAVCACDNGPPLLAIECVRLTAVRRNMWNFCF